MSSFISLNNGLQKLDPQPSGQGGQVLNSNAENTVGNQGSAASLQADTESNRPSAGTTGRIFLSTDTGAVYYDDGSQWITMGEELSNIEASDLASSPSDGNVLGYNSSGGLEWTSSGASSLDGLSDVEASSPSDGYVLTYNSSAGYWEPQSSSGGASALDGLSDVEASNPSDGYVLTYNSSAGYWEPQSGGGGGGMSELVDDTSPVLGGHLDTNGYAIGNDSGSYGRVAILGNHEGSIDSVMPYVSSNGGQVHLAVASISAGAYGYGTVEVNGDGDLAVGRVQSPYSPLKTEGDGAFVHGQPGSSDGMGIYALDHGAFAGGQASGVQSSGKIEASGAGSFIHGSSNGDMIASGEGAVVVGDHAYSPYTTMEASGDGSFVGGFMNQTSGSYATADGSFQWGPGSNDVMHSLKIGDGIHILGDYMPNTYSNGMIWVSGSDIFARSGGNNMSLSDIGSGGGGSAVQLDLGDDGSYNSSDLSEIATSNDTNNIFSNPTGDKLLVDMSYNWPTADDVNINGKTSITAASDDELIVADYSDSNNSKKVTAQSIADLSSGSGASTLDGLNDVEASSPSDGYVLTYNSSAGYWEPQASSGGGGSTGGDMSDNLNLNGYNLENSATYGEFLFFGDDQSWSDRNSSVNVTSGDSHFLVGSLVTQFNGAFSFSGGRGNMIVGLGYNGGLESDGNGSIAHGYGFGGTVTASGDGSLAGGSFSSYGANGYIESSGIGSLAHGYAMYDHILAAGNASMAQVCGGSTPPGYAYANGDGSMVLGYTGNSQTLKADGTGSLALGDSTYDGGGSIYANATASVQIGLGTNDEPTSLKTGSGVHILSSVPGVKADGMIWLDGSDVIIRSGGNDVNVSNL